MNLFLPKNNWRAFFEHEAQQPYFIKLLEFLNGCGDFYPRCEQIFNCFCLTDLSSVSVVILGQDPYHQPSQAMGLCFSVPYGITVPPSLVNIYKEIESSTGRKTVNSGGDLTPWAQQGVLLLNTLLTVKPGCPLSHKGVGWEFLTDRVIELTNLMPSPIVFMLWGKNAIEKRALLNNPRHLVLSSPHPSPLSAYNGFFGCGHFRKCNEFLIKNNKKPIVW